MIIHCESCLRKFIVKDKDIPKAGRTVQCGYCSVVWHQMPVYIEKINQTPSKVDKIFFSKGVKASDGKTYKFLGGQWARLMPSGKTGLFAKKKIGQELDKLTERKIKVETIKKKIERELDPSSQNLSDKNQLPDIYKGKRGLGFFGYIFVLIIISLSAVGLLKTFENDLINYFPQLQSIFEMPQIQAIFEIIDEQLIYIFEIIDEQLIYIKETAQNIITLIKDLINSY